MEHSYPLMGLGSELADTSDLRHFNRQKTDVTSHQMEALQSQQRLKQAEFNPKVKHPGLTRTNFLLNSTDVTSARQTRMSKGQPSKHDAGKEFSEVWWFTSELKPRTAHTASQAASRRVETAKSRIKKEAQVSEINAVLKAAQDWDSSRVTEGVLMDTLAITQRAKTSRARRSSGTPHENQNQTLEASASGLPRRSASSLERFQERTLSGQYQEHTRFGENTKRERIRGLIDSSKKKLVKPQELSFCDSPVLFDPNKGINSRRKAPKGGPDTGYDLQIYDQWMSDGYWQEQNKYHRTRSDLMSRQCTRLGMGLDPDDVFKLTKKAPTAGPKEESTVKLHAVPATQTKKQSSRRARTVTPKQLIRDAYNFHRLFPGGEDVDPVTAHVSLGGFRKPTNQFNHKDFRFTEEEQELKVTMVPERRRTFENPTIIFPKKYPKAPPPPAVEEED